MRALSAASATVLRQCKVRAVLSHDLNTRPFAISSQSGRSFAGGRTAVTLPVRGKDLTFSAAWLFYNAPSTMMEGTNQKLNRAAVASSAGKVATIPSISNVRQDRSSFSLAPSSSSSTSPNEHDAVTIITWSDGSEDSFSAEFLAAHDPSPSNLHSKAASATPRFLGTTSSSPASSSSSSIPLPPSRSQPRPRGAGAAHASTSATSTSPFSPSFAHPPIGRDSLSGVSFTSLFSSRKEEAERAVHACLKAVNEDGLALIRGAPLDEGTVLKVSDRISYGPMPTIYGHSFEVAVVPDPINIAYAPGGLDLHMDLAYYESPPGLQLLHCRAFDKDVVGGESTFLDGFYAAEVLRKRSPADFDVLTRVPATFQKIHYAREKAVHMPYQRPHIAVRPDPRSSSTSHSGGSLVTGLYWAPMFEGVLEVHPEDVEPYYKAYAAFVEVLADIEADGRMFIQYRAEPGDIVVFNNRRMLHGRRNFATSATRSAGGSGAGASAGAGVGCVGGRRVLEGCYINIDEYKSRYAYLCTKYGMPDGGSVKRVGNGDLL